jgi:hypothetical protein
VFERRRRKFLRIAEIGPDVAAELARRVSLDRRPIVLALVILLPRHHDAAPFAVEAKTMQDALQMPVKDAANRQLHAAVRATVVHHVGTAVRAAPSHQVLAERGETHGRAGCHFFRLQDRIPVIAQPLRQTGRQIGGNILDACQGVGIDRAGRGRRGDACCL